MWLPILATDLIQISLSHFWVQIHAFKACFSSNVLGEGVLLVHRGALSFSKRTRSPGRMNAPWSDKVTIQGQSDTVGIINGAFHQPDMAGKFLLSTAPDVQMVDFPLPCANYQMFLRSRSFRDLQTTTKKCCVKRWVNLWSGLLHQTSISLPKTVINAQFLLQCKRRRGMQDPKQSSAVRCEQHCCEKESFPSAHWWWDDLQTSFMRTRLLKWPRRKNYLPADVILENGLNSETSIDLNSFANLQVLNFLNHKKPVSLAWQIQGFSLTSAGQAATSSFQHLHLVGPGVFSFIYP